MSGHLANTLLALIVLSMLSACGDADAGATVRFELGDEVPDFAAVPFPSELYRDDEGVIAIGAFPNPHDGDAVFDGMRRLLSQRDGFCATCAVTFTIDGELGDDVGDDDVRLIDIDESSPDFGVRIPVRVQWDASRGWLSARPARGEALVGGRRYAAYVTTSLGVVASPAFEAARDGVGRAGEVLAPALSALEALGVARDSIAGLAAFTTEDPTRDLIALREGVISAPAPVVTVDRVVRGAELDALLGIPEAPGPGVDVAPAEGSEGSRAVSHDTTRLIVMGSFTAPRFVAGSGADVGVLNRDASGSPESRSSDSVPFLLIVPEGADLSRLPVVVAQHGFNSSRVTGLVLADTAGRAGYAVLAIDAFQHGDRAASAKDELHVMRGDLPGADGLAEANMLDVSSRMFGLSGGEEGMTLFPGYALAAFEQFAADIMSTLRFVRDGDLTALRSADTDLAELAFDATRSVFVGNSMGAVVGTAVVTAEPELGAAVLNVMPGSIISTLCESGEFRPLSTTLLLPQIGVTEELDEVERSLIFDPTVDLFRWVLEPIDPLALAPYLVRHRRSETEPPSLLIQLAGHDEVAAPAASESVVAAAGVPGVGELAFAPVAPADFPGDANIAAVRFPGAMHGMMEVREQASRFEEPLLPPFVSRTSPALIHNPIEAVHTQIEVFLRSFAEDGYATIEP